MSKTSPYLIIAFLFILCGTSSCKSTAAYYTKARDFAGEHVDRCFHQALFCKRHPEHSYCREQTVNTEPDTWQEDCFLSKWGDEAVDETEKAIDETIKAGKKADAYLEKKLKELEEEGLKKQPVNIPETHEKQEYEPPAYIEPVILKKPESEKALNKKVLKEEQKDNKQEIQEKGATKDKSKSVAEQSTAKKLKHPLELIKPFMKPKPPKRQVLKNGNVKKSKSKNAGKKGIKKDQQDIKNKKEVKTGKKIVESGNIPGGATEDTVDFTDNIKDLVPGLKLPESDKKPEDGKSDTQELETDKSGKYISSE